MTKFISVDAGKGNTKASFLKADGTIKHNLFPTKYRSACPESEVNSNEILVEMNGECYIIGTGSQGKDEALNISKESPLHRFCTMAAIANFIDNGDEVCIIVGCPANIYNNPKRKEQYRNYLVPEGPVNFRFKLPGDTKMREKNFKIKKSVVAMEGMGIFFLENRRFASGFTAVVDIGSLNVNGEYFENGAIIPEYTVTTNDGFQSLVTLITSTLSTEFGDDIKEVTIESKLKNRERSINSTTYPNAKAESPAIFDSAIKNYIDKVFVSIKAKNWDLANCNLIFIGGTSDCIRNEIEAYCLAHSYGESIYFPENPIFANADGFVTALSMMLQ